MLKHPYLSSATARLNFIIIDKTWCKTMATDGFNIFVNENFSKTLDENEVIAVFAHEIMHCILGHLDRRGNRDKVLWNIAIDYSTNLMLSDFGFTLPDSALLSWQFKGMTSEDIFERLKNETDTRIEELINKRENFSTSDVHLDPDELKGAMERKHKFPSKDERKRLRKEWVKSLSQEVHGKISGEISAELKKSYEQEIDWRAYLFQFMTGLRRDDFNFFPPNKKHIWRNIYLPTLGSPGPNHIIVSIDTSGSMSQKLLEKIISEIDSLRQLSECKLTIIQCDFLIKNVKTYDSWELTEEIFNSYTIKGRGGTSLIPPFKWIVDYIKSGNQIPDGLIYLTDGFGDIPKQEPFFPCLWIAPIDGLKEFPFGQVMRVNSKNFH